MKHPSVTTPNLDEEIVSDCSMSFVDDISCHDAAELKQALMFLKGVMKAKNEELRRLREEKNEAIESKFCLMAEMGGLKNQVEMQAKMLVPAKTGKEEAIKKVTQKFLQALEENETVTESAGKMKEEMEKMVKNAIDAALNQQTANVAQTVLSLQEALNKISNLEKEMEHNEKAKKEELRRLREEKNEAIDSKFSLMAEIALLKNQVEMQATMLVQAEKEKEKVIEEMTNKLMQEQKEKGAAIQSAREIEEALAEMKGAMKAQGDEMTRLCEEKDAVLESKFCIMAEVKGLTREIEMQAKMLVQAQADKEEAQKEKENAIERREEATQKLLQALEEKQVAIESARQQTAEATSKLAQTDQTLKEALEKISKFEKELEHKNSVLGSSVWKSSRSKVISHSGDDLWNDVLNCAPLQSGTFEWKIRVHSAHSNWLHLGVIGSSLKLPLDSWIGYKPKTWGYESNGGKACYWQDGQQDIRNLPKYTAGSVVHFVLNLTEGGILSVSIDGAPLVQVFSNMKSLIDDQDEGFLPAASMDRTTKIELLDFKCCR